MAECIETMQSQESSNGKKPNLSNERRNSILHMLLQHRKSNGKLQMGTLTQIATSNQVSTKTCKRIWDRYLESVDENGIGGNVDSREKKSGRNRKNNEADG